MGWGKKGGGGGGGVSDAFNEGVLCQTQLKNAHHTT